MINILKKMFQRNGSRKAPPSSGNSVRTNTPVAKKPAPIAPPETVELEPKVAGRVVSNGPGKNVLVRTTFQKEDGSALEDLKIVDESGLDPSDGSGIDPYNTGQFDRSKNWDKRYLK